MKKGFLLILSSITLLVSCSDPSSSSEKTFDSSNAESSSEAQEDAELLSELGNELLELEGNNIVKSNTTYTLLVNYIGGLEMYVTNEYETTRYIRENSFLKEAKGSQTINDEEAIPFVEQTFDNSKRFYKIKVWDGGEREQKSAQYSEDNLESVYHLGQAYTEIENFNYMLNNVGETDTTVVEYFFDNIEGVITNDKLSYNYAMNIYTIDEDTGEKAIYQSLAYENVFTIENNLITHLSQKYRNELYAGDQKQTYTVNLEEDYVRGEFTTFEGELLSVGLDTD